MVRVVAEVSSNYSTASSSDRYKYRYGYKCSGHESAVVTYRRPLSIPKEDTIIGFISDKIDKMNDVVDTVTAMITARRGHEKHEKREIRENSIHSNIKKENEEKPENQEKKEKQEKKRENDEKIKMMETIHHKLGKIVYHSKSGKIFTAYHSTQVFSFFDKNLKYVTTQKVVWNDKTYNSKEIWFSEMAKLSKQQADESMKIVRCE
jgi:hypothetical protein